MTHPQLEGTSHAVGLIGGIGISEVHVYAQRPAPDGKFSGCPHVHAVTDEAYLVLRGTGAVELHDLRSGYRKVPLSPGDYLHFPPMVMHRLISDDQLVILAIMGNAGLPERGEARIYFGAEVDSDPRRFDELVNLPKAHGLEGALDRRDASVQAYRQLMELCSRDRDEYLAELRRFFIVHAEAMAAKADELAEQVRRGPCAWGEQTLQRIRQLPALSEAVQPVYVNRRGADSALGMCGVLRPIVSLEELRT